MRGDTSPVWRRHVVDAGWKVALVATPLAMGLAAVVRVTQASYMVCSGSEVVATTYRIKQTAWLVALPLLCWAACICVDWKQLAGRTTMRRSEQLVRRFVISALPVLFYFWYSVRYFTLDSNGCSDGLPYWWPSFLPAR